MDGKSEKRLPGKSDIEQFLTTHPEFKNYDWKTVHIKVMNEVYKKERLAKKRLGAVGCI